MLWSSTCSPKPHGHPDRSSTTLRNLAVAVCAHFKQSKNKDDLSDNYYSCLHQGIILTLLDRGRLILTPLIVLLSLSKSSLLLYRRHLPLMPLPILSVEENYYFAIRVPLSMAVPRRTRELFDTSSLLSSFKKTTSSWLYYWEQFLCTNGLKFLSNNRSFFFFFFSIPSSIRALLSVTVFFLGCADVPS